DNDKLWCPKPQSVVCSEHFVGNKRSKDPNSPSYIPSLFPDIYKRKPVNNEQQSNRYNRKIKRQKVPVVFNDVEPLDEEIIQIPQYDKVNSVCSVGTQVMFDFNINQSHIPPLSNNSIERSVKSVTCGLDISCLKLDCFQGFNSILYDSQLKDLTGTTFKTVVETLPRAFKDNYPNCRCIIDCTEIKTEQPSSVEQRVYMYSRYKSAYTVKTLVAITPSGFITFLSKCYGTSDTFITNDSGFLSNLEMGDQVLADKGFPGIKVLCENKNSILVMPPILHNGKFSENEVIESYNVASVRIHIERVFAKLKTQGILNKITADLLPYIDDIMHICCVVTNLQNPIIKE
ncbi:THAP-type domain-containing protein, partial [Aphis craccivora]